jgi:hypothetical protein
MIHGRRAGQTVLVLTVPSSASEVLLYDWSGQFRSETHDPWWSIYLPATFLA